MAGRRVLEAGRAVVPDTTEEAIRVVLDTSDIIGVDRGLAVGTSEEVFFTIGDRYPDIPPNVYVRSDPRFVGFPHVILGRILCVYLDARREWHPTFGMAHLVDRVWEWFDNAANDRFDPRASLFHAVGGANPATVAFPTVVIRSKPPPNLPLLSLVALVERTGTRLDLVGWRRANRRAAETNVPTFRVSNFLPLGVRHDVTAVGAQIENAGGSPVRDFVRRIQENAIASPRGQPVFLCLVVEHPTEADLPAVLVGRIAADVADRLREPSPEITPDETPIDWMPVSDERPDITTARDSTRPAAAFNGESVEVWGCGGLGSWIAELIVRARPAKVTLRDSGIVHGGHLVRQNYTEADVGGLKVEQLAERLRGISDDTEVEVGGLSALDAIKGNALPDCDLVVDATINETVAYRLDQVASETAGGPLLAQVATDRGSATLGLIVIAAPASSGGPASIDSQIAETILADGSLEPFHVFWSPPTAGSELNPAPGCSIPTYHGAAADLAAIAGSMVSLLGQQLAAPTTGIYLFAAPHSGIHPPFVFLPGERI